MLCTNCNHNEANVRYTQIINGEKKEMFLCEECSKKLGIDNMKLSLPIDFASFFGDFLNEYDNDFMPILKKTNELKCDKCNMTYREFIETGKFGCDACYNIFSERIDPILKRLHGSNRYNGRKANINEIEEKELEQKEKTKMTKQEKIDNLREKIKRLIKEEKYEEAAKIRDQIKELEGENND